MIDEARIIAVMATIDDDTAVDDEQERVPVVGGLGLIATVRLAVRDAIAEILDDAGTLADAPPREHALTVQWRIAHLEHVGARRNARHGPLAPGARAGAAAGAARHGRSRRDAPGAALAGRLAGGTLAGGALGGALA